MKLSDDQKEQLKLWLADGLSLSEIYKQVSNAWKQPMTYMELRFLIDDLDLQFTEKVKPVNEGPSTKKEALSEELELLHQVVVEVDKVIRPGALVSGSVIFSDGVPAAWQLDQMGRIGLIPSKEGYKPSETDIKEFQASLQEAMQKAGY